MSINEYTLTEATLGLCGTCVFGSDGIWQNNGRLSQEVSKFIYEGPVTALFRIYRARKHSAAQTQCQRLTNMGNPQRASERRDKLKQVRRGTKRGYTTAVEATLPGHRWRGL